MKICNAQVILFSTLVFRDLEMDNQLNGLKAKCSENLFVNNITVHWKVLILLGTEGG